MLSKPYLIDSLEACLQGFPLYREFNPHINQATFAKRYQEACSHSEYRLYFIKDQKNNLVVGILGFSQCHEIYWGKYIHMDSLIVHSNYRRQGIANTLLGILEQTMDEDPEITKISWETGLQRQDAQAFYTAQGYTPMAYEYRRYRKAIREKLK